MLSKSTKEVKTFTDVKVSNVHDFGNGQIAFTAVFDDVVTIYNMRYVEGVRDGREYAFVGFPERKGTDGKYYKIVYTAISEDLQTQIVEQISQALNIRK